MKNLSLFASILALLSALTAACGSQDSASNLSSSHSSGAVVRSAAGASAADIQWAVDRYRADLGGGVNNLNALGTQPSGHREINWDGVPAIISSPNEFPGDAFRSRGILMGSPGVKLEVSTNQSEAEQAIPLFGNLNRKFPKLFDAFSPEKIFAPVNSVVTELSFVVPGSDDKATVKGFGAVFTDVDLANISKIEYFDVRGAWLHTEWVKAVAGKDKSSSFVGVSFRNGKTIGKVKLTSGNIILASKTKENSWNDAVALDDFIYGEPQAAVKSRW